MLERWISYYEDIVPNNLCNEILSYPWKWSPSKYANHNKETLNSDDRVLMDETWVGTTKLYPQIKQSILKVVDKYSGDHERFSCVHHTDFRINKYGVGGFMSKHCDNIHHSHGQNYGYPQCTILLFINDDFKGGDFFVAENKHNPAKGSALIFPSNFMFPHKVKKVTKGERWSIVSWLM